MDCCNYMQYRSHQHYGFGPGYYDHVAEYNHNGNGDFYGQHLYHDYYNSQYYPQQWSQVTHFPDYVYNPKEARIRKAMREATRDRSIGASPMLPRPGVRLPPHADWTQSQEEPLMMSPMEGMRRMDTPICSYPLPNSENNQYLQPMNGYSKIESPLLMPNYMQISRHQRPFMNFKWHQLRNNRMKNSPSTNPSPLTQLQQQTELWHPYQDNIRPRSIGTQFHHPMMSDMQPPPYHSQEPMQERATNLIMEKPRQSPACAPLALQETVSTHRVSEENSLTPPLVITGHTDPQQQLQSQSQSHFAETKITAEEMQTAVMENCHQHDYIPSTDPMLSCNSFEPSIKVEQPVVATKKNHIPSTNPSTPNHITPEGIHPTTFCASPEFFSDKYHIEYISKYFSELPDYSLITVKTKDGFSFPYASLTLNGYEESNVFLEISGLNSQPQLIPTDVGYIPVLEEDFCFDQLEPFQI